MRPLLALLLIASASGCYRPAQTPPPPAPASSTQTASADVRQCPPQDGRRIEITAGTIACADAYRTVATYDLQGKKYQQIGEFVCYSGNAQTAPVMLICSSASVEFAVSEG